VLPHPPFASELTLEQELTAFARLQPRLNDVWRVLTAESDEPSTTVVVPSMTLDQAELSKLAGVTFYEERLLFLLIRLRNPRAQMIYVTSEPVHPGILDYLLQHLLGIPANHARARLTMLCAHDNSARPLTAKILERPRLIERIRVAIRHPTHAYLSVFNSTPLERKLAVLLGIPLNGADPALAELGTKSGSRRIFRSAGVPLPAGFEDLPDERAVVEGLVALRAERPGIERAVIKLNDSFSGEGNAIFRYPDSRSRPAMQRAMELLEFVAPSEQRGSYFEKFNRGGGVVEEFLDGVESRSPSVQLRVGPNGEVLPLSTHDQILGGASGQVFLGCRFPAADGYRHEAQEIGLSVGRVLAGHGVVSRFGVDLMATRRTDGGAWDLNAIEINLRLGGTTHPFLALRFLCGGALEPASGLYRSASGRAKYYRATDNLYSARYQGLSPEDLIEIVTINQLNFDYRRETGVLFHMIGAMSQYGKVGVTAIANSHAEADAIYDRTLAVLESETRYT
jgi:hypothetical protein